MNSFAMKSALALLITSGAIKSWQAGETVTGADLNAALAHIHSKMVGGHGARLVNADIVVGTIGSDKLASYRYIPRAYATIATGCAGACTISEGNGIASAAVAGSTMTVTINTAVYNPTDSVYTVIVDGTNNTPGTHCKLGARAATTFTVLCDVHEDTSACVTTAGTACDHALTATYPEVSFVIFDAD